MKKTLLLIAVSAALLFAARSVDLYYTEDGRTVKSIRGYSLTENFTIADQGDESWLVVAGFKIGPNGYVPKESKMTLGALGKSKSQFTIMTSDFFGIGHGRRLEKAIGLNNIMYILPDTTPVVPLHVVLVDRSEGELFVASDYTESTGRRIFAGKPTTDISIIQLKYDIPKTQRGPNDMPKQYGIKAKAIAFSEQGLRQAMRALDDANH